MQEKQPSTVSVSFRERFPIPGQRIIRSVVVVWLCFAVYLLRGSRGVPVFSTMAALQCIQPYTKDIGQQARARITGTLTGMVWGIIFLYLERFLASEHVPDGWYHYLFIGLFTGLVLYFTVVFHVTDVAFFSAITFLAISIDRAGDASPLGYALVRTLDTVIGIALGTLVNLVQLPRRRNKHILFASGVGEFLLGPGSELSPYSRVELNRLIEDGARITISTMQTQATVRELLGDLDLRYPIVTMDGAALYDLKQLSYLKTNPMPPENAGRIMAWLTERNLPFFSNSIEENLLVIRYTNLQNIAMQEIYERKRRSPYRNYLHDSSEHNENIVYLLILDRTEVINAAYDALKAEPWAEAFRIEKMLHETEIEGYSGMKIYDRNTSQRAMLRTLCEMLGTSDIITFGSSPDNYDVVIGEHDKDRVVKEIRDRFEPVDFRCWKNILRL